MTEAKTELVEIQNKVLKYRDSIISVRNISEATTFIPKPAFPSYSILLIIVGILFVSIIRNSSFSFLGFIVLIAGVAWICYWYRSVQKAPRGVTLRLNSGSSITFSFPDHDLAKKVMTAIEDSMQKDGVNLSFELSNATIINSAVGNIGSNIGSPFDGIRGKQS